MNLDSLLMIISAATSIVKLLVDGFKMAVPDIPPAWVIGMAFVAGVGISFLLHLYGGLELNAQTSAGAVLAGIMAAGGAIGLTAAHKAARASTDEGKKVP